MKLASKLVLIMMITLTGACRGSSTMTDSTQTPDAGGEPAGEAFTRDTAGRLLGHPAAKIIAFNELLPSFFQVTFEEGGRYFPEEVVWLEGRRFVGHGLAGLSEYARRVRLYEASALETYGVARLLGALGAFPSGFEPNDQQAIDTATGATSNLVRDPFTFVVFHLGYAKAPAGAATPEPPDAPDPGAPTFAPSSPGGPAGAPSGPAGPGPSGPGPSGPGPSGPGPGAGTMGRATLRGDAGYAFAWKVEVRVSPGQPWALVEEVR